MKLFDFLKDVVFCFAFPHASTFMHLLIIIFGVFPVTFLITTILLTTKEQFKQRYNEDDLHAVGDYYSKKFKDHVKFFLLKFMIMLREVFGIESKDDYENYPHKALRQQFFLAIF